MSNLSSKVLAVIPARYASTRFPGKPLVPINGKPMIQLVYEKVIASERIDLVVVATDDKRIFEVVENFGGNVMMTSEDHQSGTDRCGEVAIRHPDYDTVINIQGDEPFIPTAMIDELIGFYQKHPSNQIATLSSRIDNLEDLKDPNVVKVVSDLNGKALYFSRHAIPFQRKYPIDQWLDHHSYFKHIGMYIFDRAVLIKLIKLNPSTLELQESLEQLRWIENGFEIVIENTQYSSIGIDTPEDLKNAL